MRRVLFSLLPLVAACGSITAEQRAAMAKVAVTVTEPAPSCQNLGSVSGDVRLKAVQLGANTVRLDAPTATSGTAFFCPAPSSGPSLPPIIEP
jgi:hypothetical protein